MNLTEVINSLVEERGLKREKIVEIVCEGVLAAYVKRFPDMELEVNFNQKLGAAEVFAKKKVVRAVENEDREISLRRAKIIDSKAELDGFVKVPLEERIGRIEIAAAKQLISNKIREIEQLAVFNEFKDKEGSIITGMAHKKERGGVVVKIGDVMALLPKQNLIANESIRIGYPIRALLREVAAIAHGGYQVFLDRASADFVKKLIELEIPEVFEGLVEIKKIVRVPGYKTKVIVVSHSKEIDPVGTCVGVGGARIKPILKELGQEKIDLIEWTENIEELVKESLKPAEIDKVELVGENLAMVWLAQDQRSIAIGKMGKNIMLASKLIGIEIQLQEVQGQEPEVSGDSVLSDDMSGDDRSVTDSSGYASEEAEDKD